MFRYWQGSQKYASYSSSASVSVWWCTGREAAPGSAQLTPWRRPQWPHPPRASQTFSCNSELLKHLQDHPPRRKEMSLKIKNHVFFICFHTFFCFSCTKTHPTGYNPSFFIGTAKLDPVHASFHWWSGLAVKMRKMWKWPKRKRQLFTLSLNTLKLVFDSFSILRSLSQ